MKDGYIMSSMAAKMTTNDVVREKHAEQLKTVGALIKEASESGFYSVRVSITDQNAVGVISDFLKNLEYKVERDLELYREVDTQEDKFKLLGLIVNWK